MDRRKFLKGSAAAGAASIASSAAAGMIDPQRHVTETGSAAKVRVKKSPSRLKYPLTAEEKQNGTVIFDLTYGPGDPRRYSPPKTLAEPEGSTDPNI